MCRRRLLLREEYDRTWWRNDFGINEREEEYIQMKSQLKNICKRDIS